VFNESAPTALSPFCPIGQLIVVDIPLMKTDSIKGLMYTLYRLPLPAEVLLRLIGPRTVVIPFCQTLTISCQGTRVYPVYSSSEYIELWVHFILDSSTVMVPASGDYIIPVNKSIDPHSNLRVLGGGREYLRSMLFGPYYQSGLGDLDDSYTILHALLASSIGELEHRFSTNQWKVVIQALVSASILSSSNPISSAHRVLREETATLMNNGKQLTVYLPDQIRRSISHILSRVL
jgi:hypothetical protein